MPIPMPANLITYAKRGPFPVGLRRFELCNSDTADRTLPVDLWYPARSNDDASSHPAADHPLNAPHDARMDLDPEPGPIPLVVFSHGNAGYARQSTFLMTHLASFGIAVAAPDHVGNTFLDSIKIESEDERKRMHFEARAQRPRDLMAVTDAVLEDRPGWPKLDPEAVAVLGHSYGGWTSCKMPGIDSRVRAVCVLAPASEAFVGRKAFSPGELPFAPVLPALLVAGLDDVLVDCEESIRKLFERMAPPRALVGLEDADHFHFCDAVPMLHGLHEANKRPNQPRPARPYSELLPEARTHRALSALVTSFFQSAFDSSIADPTAHLASSQLEGVDPALKRLA